MKHSIKMVLVVVLAVMSFATVQTVWANEEVLWPDASGEVIGIDRDLSTIVILDIDSGLEVTVAGFPFGYLERELDIQIELEDCVTVDYAAVFCKCDEMVYKNIAVALTGYCEECPGSEEMDSCDVDNIVLRDDDFYPVDKSRYGDDSTQHRGRLNDGKGGPVTIPPGD
jgi:hypothetical protein